MNEDQDRDFISHVRGRLEAERSHEMLCIKKIVGDRDILGKGLEHFWNDFRKATGELCERLSREFGLSLSCRWNGKELNVTSPKKHGCLSATRGDAPPYEVVLLGHDGFRYSATIRIRLDDSQLGWLVVLDDSPTSARKVASHALEAFVFAQ